MSLPATKVFSINAAHIRISQQHGTALGRFAVLEQALSFTDPNHKACLRRDSARASTFLLMNICSRHGGEQSCQVIKCIAKLKAKCMNQTFVSLCSLISKTDQNKIKSNREILSNASRTRLCFSQRLENTNEHRD